MYFLVDIIDELTNNAKLTAGSTTLVDVEDSRPNSEALSTVDSEPVNEEKSKEENV